MGSSEKRPKYIMNDIPTFRAKNLQNNLKVIQNRNNWIQWLTGFVCYFVVMLITSIRLMAKAGFSPDFYFDSLNRILFDGILGGHMSFVLFWTHILSDLHLQMKMVRQHTRSSSSNEDGETTHKKK